MLQESDEMPSVLISYPGSEIPEWFTFQNEEPFVSVMHLPQGWFSENLVCFALCAVVAFRDYHDDGRGLVLVCECEFKSQEGYCHVAKGSLFGWGDDSSGTDYVGSDHVFMGCDFAMYPKKFGEYYYTNEFSAQFYLEDYHSKLLASCEVEKCGLRLIYQHEYGKSLLSISADEDYFCKNLEETIGSFSGDMEEEEPYPKSCKLSKELLMQKSTTGLLEIFGGGDVRIQALRIPEHCGLVDGLGKFFPSAHQFRDITTERRLADSESTDQCCQLDLDSKENVVAPNDESLIKVKDEDTSQKVTNFQHVQKQQKLHPTIAVFSKLVDRCVDNSTVIELNNEEGPFGTQCSTLITAEDCRIMINMTQLTVSCINAYIRMLYNQLKDDGRLGQFAFINPESVSLAGGPDNAIRSNERAHEVASCLQKATGTRFVFMPYNPG
ncbi:hypothetical protein LWI29_035173 [Acer saccharum]|uniref:C-JID domain-containing protein n=1 Tax=Acer saccharum TaxID=4024 RepID=A0AA39SW39_ACESA|nr:hypothetical protein LWI29_035173 [Acer saccharum]